MPNLHFKRLCRLLFRVCILLDIFNFSCIKCDEFVAMINWILFDVKGDNGLSLQGTSSIKIIYDFIKATLLRFWQRRVRNDNFLSVDCFCEDSLRFNIVVFIKPYLEVFGFHQTSFQCSLDSCPSSDLMYRIHSLQPQQFPLGFQSRKTTIYKIYKIFIF